MKKVYMWQNNMCITYNVLFKRFELFFLLNEYRLTAHSDEADIVMVGACGGFLPQIEEFKEKLLSMNLEDKQVIVFGCLPKVTPKDYFENVPSHTSYVPSSAPDMINDIFVNAKVKWGNIPFPNTFRREDYRNFDPGKRYFVIQYGCNSKCVYCPHVIGMGPQASRPMNKILNEIKKAVTNENIHTLFIEGQDSGSFGTDLTPQSTFPELLKYIVHLPYDFDIHIGQLNAHWLVHYGQELFDLLLNPKIKDIKIPIQTKSERLLNLMGRDPNVYRLEDFLKQLRSQKHRPTLRTDLIIGFPTETLDELNDTLAFVKTYFDEAACFGFEIHPNTPVANMALPFFDQNTIEQRAAYAIDFLEQDTQIIAHRGGQVYQTLIEREKRKGQQLCANYQGVINESM